MSVWLCWSRARRSNERRHELMANRVPRTVVPFPVLEDAVPTATEIRSTVRMASVQALRDHDWLDAYERAAPPKLLETIQTAVVGSWLPLEIADAHYTTCDSLAISVLEQIEIGGDVARRLPQTLLGNLANVARASGAVSPLTVLRRFNQLHAQSWIGSAGRSWSSDRRTFASTSSAFRSCTSRISEARTAASCARARSVTTAAPSVTPRCAAAPDRT